MEQQIKKEIDKKQKVSNIFFGVLWFIIGTISGFKQDLKILWLLLPLIIYQGFTVIMLADLWCKVGGIFFAERFKEFEIEHNIKESEEKE